MNVPFIDLKAQYTTIQDEIQLAVQEVVDAQSFILGPIVQRFEREAAEYLGVKHAIGVANGSDALYLALRALEIGAGDEVITVPHTYVATPEAIRRVGAKVVFCDVHPWFWNLDADDLNDHITPRTRAVMPVHIYGQCADMSAINELSGSIPVIEDAAQSWGADHWGSKAGTLGRLGCFSFYPTKNLGAYGDGGMVVTDDDELAERLRSLRVHGQSKRRYYSDIAGINSRLDAMQAAVLSVKLKHIDRWNATRRKIAEYYNERFTGSVVKTPRVQEGNTHVYHLYVIEAPRRDELMAFLESKGIGAQVYYPVPQHFQTCFKDLGHEEGDFPVAETLAKTGLALPCWPEMSEAQRADVADQVLAFYGRK